MLLDGAFSCTLSGHSHRAAHYRISEKVDGPIRHDFKVRGCAPCARSGKYDLKNDGPHIVVSPSGGPIPVQNHQGELAGQGLDLPSGTQIGFSPEGEITEIRVRHTRNPKAKPRLAVALDYADLLGPEDDGPGTVFSLFEQLTWGGPFQIEVNPQMGLPEVQWIKDIRVLVQDDNRIKSLNTEFSFVKPGIYSLTVQESMFTKMLGISDKYSYYIEVHLHEGLKEHDYFNVYDVSDNWIWRCEFIDRQKEELEKFRRSIDLSPEPVPEKVIKMREADIRSRFNGMRIQRHKDFGEIPYLPDYSRYFGMEYKFPWKTRKKSGDPKS